MVAVHIHLPSQPLKLRVTRRAGSVALMHRDDFYRQRLGGRQHEVIAQLE